MLHEYTWRDKVQEILDGVVTPLGLTLDFRSAIDYLKRNPEEKWAETKEKCGLNSALDPNKYKPYDSSIEGVLECMRHGIAVADLCKAKGVPFKRNGPGQLFEGHISNETIEELWKRTNESEFKAWLKSYNVNI